MNARPVTRYAAILILSAFSLCSCDKNSKNSDITTFIQNLKNTDVNSQRSDSIAISRQPQPKSVSYKPTLKRSPFEMMEAITVKKSDASNPLQAYPLNMLRFVGTVTRKGQNIAFITAPDNKLYQVKVGDMIGDKDSEISTIESNRISLIETYTENGNTQMKRVVTLQLKDANQ